MPPWMTPSFSIKYSQHLFLHCFLCARLGFHFPPLWRPPFFDGIFNKSQPRDQRGVSCYMWVLVLFTHCWASRMWDLVLAVIDSPEQLERWGGKTHAKCRLVMPQQGAVGREVPCGEDAVALKGIGAGAIGEASRTDRNAWADLAGVRDCCGRGVGGLCCRNVSSCFSMIR